MVALPWLRPGGRTGNPQMDHVYWVGGKLLRAAESFSKESSARVRVDREQWEYFLVKAGLRQGCVMSLVA